MATVVWRQLYGDIRVWTILRTEKKSVMHPVMRPKRRRVIAVYSSYLVCMSINVAPSETFRYSRNILFKLFSEEWNNATNNILLKEQITLSICAMKWMICAKLHNFQFAVPIFMIFVIYFPISNTFSVARAILYTFLAVVAALQPFYFSTMNIRSFRWFFHRFRIRTFSEKACTHTCTGRIPSLSRVCA